MRPTDESRAVSGPFGLLPPPEVRVPRTCATLRTSRGRGAAVTVARGRVAGRSAAVLLGLAVSAAGAAALAGCDPRQTGNGVYAEKAIRVAEFAGVRAEDGIGAVITVAPGLAQTVIVTGDENVIERNIRTSVDVEGAGTAAVAVLHVWASPSFTPVIPPRVVITRPSLTLVRGGDGVFIEVKRPAGAADVGGPLTVDLDGATLSAREYPVSGAVVALEAGATARLRSEGPVTGTVAGDSHLDNTAGAGPCLVSTTAGGSVACN